MVLYICVSSFFLRVPLEPDFVHHWNLIGDTLLSISLGGISFPPDDLEDQVEQDCRYMMIHVRAVQQAPLWFGQIQHAWQRPRLWPAARRGQCWLGQGCPIDGDDVPAKRPDRLPRAPSQLCASIRRKDDAPSWWFGQNSVPSGPHHTWPQSSATQQRSSGLSCHHSTPFSDTAIYSTWHRGLKCLKPLSTCWFQPSQVLVWTNYGLVHVSSYSPKRQLVLPARV